MFIRSFKPYTLGLVCFAAACASPAVDDQAVDSTSAFTSDKATLLDFELDGELLTDGPQSPNAAIQNQLFYSVGALNEQSSVGRLDAMKITNVTTEAAGTMTRVKYHAVLPVGWGSKYSLPTSYELKLPRDVSYRGLEAFSAKYSKTCVDTWSAHDVGAGNYWYFYRTGARGCALDANDAVTLHATVTRSSLNAEAKYPEYDRIWADGVLHAIVIFGKDQPGATGWSDFGISAYGRFNSLVRNYAAGVKVSPTPANIPGAPSTDFPDVAWEGTYADGRKIKINALLVDSLRSYDPRFDARYAELSPTADVIIYNGHAAFGDNVRALTRKGKFVAGQYTIVSMMGCDSFAYVDGYMAQERARLNPDDPSGTRYLDMITNVTPANPTWFPQEAADMLSMLGDVARPSSYSQILHAWEPKHIAVVTGDEDNTFTPAR